MIHGLTAAIALARASATAYFPGTDADIIGNGLCNAVVSRVGPDIIVAFQGTNSGSDWLSNISHRQIKTPYGMVHEGFESTLAKCRMDIVMAAMPDDHEQLWITGHSRGAAHALAFAAYMTHLGAVPAGVYTFACPRVGDSHFAAFCDKHLAGRHHRFVYQSDIVTRLPIIGYRHCGEVHWHDGHEWRRRMPLHSRIGAFLFARKWPFFGDAAADHSIQQYINALTPETSLCNV